VEYKKVHGSDDAKAINTHLSRIEAELDFRFIVLQSQFHQVTPAMLKNSFKRKPEMKAVTAEIEKEKIPTLLELADFHIQEFSELAKVGLRSKETLKQWNSTRKKIFEFIRYTLNHMISNSHR